MHCICKAKKGDFGIWGAMVPLPPKSAYGYYGGSALVNPTRDENSYATASLIFRSLC